jgi:hypothetical protein
MGEALILLPVSEGAFVCSGDGRLCVRTFSVVVGLSQAYMLQS